MDVATTELKLPETKQTVTLKRYLTMGQLKAIQRDLVGEGSVNQDEALKNVTLDKAYAFQDKIAQLVVAEIKFPDGQTKAYTTEWLDSLPTPDGNLFLEKINSYAGSQLSEEDKKK